MRSAPHLLEGAGSLRSVTDANCFICLPEDGGSVAPGDLVEVRSILDLF